MAESKQASKGAKEARVLLDCTIGNRKYRANDLVEGEMADLAVANGQADDHPKAVQKAKDIAAARKAAEQAEKKER